MFAVKRATKLVPGPTKFVLMFWKLEVPMPHSGWFVICDHESWMYRNVRR